MGPMVPDTVANQLQFWVGKPVFVHLEVNPGAYWRNGKAVLLQAHVRGEGHYRLFLEFEGAGLIHVDDLTHMQVSSDMVICTGYDSSDRIARTIEISPTPFAM